MFPAAKRKESFLVAVGGARGVGKTTTLKNLAIKNPDFRVISLGEELNNLSINKLGKSFFDIEIVEKDIIRKEHGNDLISRISPLPNVFLLDLHYTDLREKEEKIIQPEIILQNIDVFVFFDAEKELILHRMLVDSEKRGRIQSVSYIERDRIAEMVAAKSLAEKYGKTFFYLDTRSPVEETTLELHRFLEKTLPQARRGIERGL